MLSANLLPSLLKSFSH